MDIIVFRMNSLRKQNVIDTEWNPVFDDYIIIIIGWAKNKNNVADTVYFKSLPAKRRSR